MQILYLILQILLFYYLSILTYHINGYFMSKRQSLSNKKLMIVFGSGGHTTEMLLMLKDLNFTLYKQVIFVLGHSDTWSQTKIQDFYQKTRQINNVYTEVPNLEVRRLFRSREVKQSYVTSVFTTLMGLVHSVKMIAMIRPDIVISNGPGTAVPLCYAQFGISKLLLWNPKAKILFIESFCRVTSLSLSGKLLYPIASKFIVHWDELKTKHKNVVLFKDKIL